MNTRLLIAATAVLLASCANDPATQAAGDDKVYATGSNIARRDRGVHTMTPEAFEQIRNSSAGNTGRGPSP